MKKLLGPLMALAFATSANAQTLPSPAFSGLTVVNGLTKPTADGQHVLFQNGPKSAFNIYGPNAAPTWFDWENVRSVIDVEPPTVVGTGPQNHSAYGAWIWNNAVWDAAGGKSPAGIGLQTYCITAVAGAGCFGINPGFTDTYDNTTLHSVAGILAGGEVDFSTYNTGSSATGFSFVIQGPVQPAGATALAMYRNNATVAKWSNGFFIDDGALNTGGAGIYLGMLNAATGNSIQSDPIAFGIHDTAGNKRIAYISAFPSGVGNESIFMRDGSGGNGVAFVLNPAGASPVIQAAGTDTNIDLTLQGKGTGTIALFGVPTTGTATGTVCVASGNRIYIKTTSGACL